jgi:hypothetical protein
MLDRIFKDADVQVTEAVNRLRVVTDFGLVAEDALAVARGLTGNKHDTMEPAEVVLAAVRRVPDPLERLPLLEEIAEEAAGKSDYLAMNAAAQWRDTLGVSLPTTRYFSAYDAFRQTSFDHLKRAAAQAVLDYHTEVSPGVATSGLTEVEKFALTDKNFALKEGIEAALNELPVRAPRVLNPLPERNHN